VEALIGRATIIFAFEQKLNSPALTGQRFEQFARCVERIIVGIVFPAQRAVDDIRKRA
jgi:hypothetical protein